MNKYTKNSSKVGAVDVVNAMEGESTETPRSSLALCIGAIGDMLCIGVTGDRKVQLKIHSLIAKFKIKAFGIVETKARGINKEKVQMGLRQQERIFLTSLSVC